MNPVQSDRVARGKFRQVSQKEVTQSFEEHRPRFWGRGGKTPTPHEVKRKRKVKEHPSPPSQSTVHCNLLLR